MGVDLVLVLDAVRDLEDGYAWYEKRRPGLGEEFLSCVDACFEGIRRDPERHERIFEDYRRALVRRFPYAVFYEHSKTAVTVYAILHTSRSPAKWRTRLP